MVEKPKTKQVIKYRTAPTWGLAPLPETTYELSTDGIEDKVQFVHTAGQAKMVRTFRVPSGSYNRWLEILIATSDQESLGQTFGSFMDGSSEDLWFVNKGKKVHLKWMVEPPEDQTAISDFIKWLHGVKLNSGDED